MRIHVCATCVLEMPRPCIRLYRLVSLRREFVTASRLFAVSSLQTFPSSSTTTLYSFSSPSLPPRSHSVRSRRSTTRGCIGKVTSARVPGARRRTNTGWTNSPLGHFSDEYTQSGAVIGRRTHTRIRTQPFRWQIAFVSRVSRR